MTTISSSLPSESAFPESFNRHWVMHLVMGIAAVVLGVIGLYVAAAVTLVSVIFFGWLLVVAGAARLVHAFYTRRWQGVLLHVLLGILWIVVGVLMVVFPGMGALSLTLALATMFLVGGLFKI